MPINFDGLPQDNPFALPENGLYKGHIATAEMKTPKPKMVNGESVVGKDYLNLKIELFNENNEKKGVIFDILSESDSSVVQYKIGKFAHATGLPTSGSMELKDIAKLVNGKDVGVDVIIDKKGDQPRAVVDVFSGGVYYTIPEYKEQWIKLHPDIASQDFMQIDESGEAQPFNTDTTADGAAATDETEY